MSGRIATNLRQRSLSHQRTTFLAASGLSTAGSFAGLTTKGWILLQGSDSPLLLALHFAMLALPTLVVSGWAGVATDRHGAERVLIWAQWGLFAAALLGAVAIPLTTGTPQLVMLLGSTLLMGVASAYELTARNKYCALLVPEPEQLGGYLTSFSVVFNLGKLVGPPLGGWLVAVSGPAVALAIDAATYLVPIAVVIGLMQPQRDLEIRSAAGQAASLATAWQEAGSTLRHVMRFAAAACLACFFHPALAPLMAKDVLGPSPQALGAYTGILAAGSIVGGVLLRRHSLWLSERPALLLGGCTTITGLAQLAMAVAGLRGALWVGLAGTFAIGAGTAALLAGVNMISQVGAPVAIRGRMAGLGQIAFLGGGGASGLLASLITMGAGLVSSFAVLGGIALALGARELIVRGGMRLQLRST
ncbi:MAG: MFS transporter [Cyanobacteriota bacterium]|nr:MFS transporter [Cyanobacteriota bacterium]